MNQILNKLLLLLRQMEYLVTDRNLTIVEISDGLERFADVPEDLAVGEDVRQAFPELYGMEDILEDVLAGNQDRFELKGIGRVGEGGAHLYFDLHAIAHHEQNFDGWLLGIEEVTDKMALEQTLVQASNEMELLVLALNKAKDYIDKIITSMADALIVTTAEGKIKTINKAAQNLFGYEAAELIGMPIAVLVAPSERHRMLPTVPQSGDEEWNGADMLCQTKGGCRLTVSFSRSLLETDIEGAGRERATGAEKSAWDFVYIGRDVTAQKRRYQRQAAQNTVNRILSEGPEVGEALVRTLAAIAENTGWDGGELWMVEPGPRLRRVDIWPKITPVNTDRRAKPFTLAVFGEGLAGRVWATGEPQWQLDGFESPPVVGMRGALAFPIQSGGEVLGVIVLCSVGVVEVDEDLLSTAAAIGNQLGQFIQRQRAEKALLLEQKKTERLLVNILPEQIASRLKQESAIIAESFNDVTVLFADIVGFTQMAACLNPIELVEILNKIFSQFDRLTEKHGLEKIKTIGDAYMVVGGLPVPRDDHAQAIAQMALDMQTSIAEFNAKYHKTLSIRIGIHSGPVVAGVIGIKKFIYDLWGDTVNTASRMESHGLAGTIHISSATYELIKSEFLFEKRGAIQVKGKGEMRTYFLTGKKKLGDSSDESDSEFVAHSGDVRRKESSQSTLDATRRLVEIIEDKL
ncbi:MAG TPA: PAS domain S-box protein [Oscillatoriaceae cyanobacterium M33_DOE_052]|uniref:PAS domain S-box protein n=1 Tax=Planktothricoides sp. SpSt-374 TaxID=2282167 RepID=A0A7C3ZNC1_9CYAN|nr:PAS domain S-box protein [Oscillatoriaceae cyanobacterium M33_DOE_052]